MFFILTSSCFHIILLLQSLNFTQAIQEGSTETIRYYIQDIQRRAIFGSHKYNPVNQKFEKHDQAGDQAVSQAVDQAVSQAVDQAVNQAGGVGGLIDESWLATTTKCWSKSYTTTTAKYRDTSAARRSKTSRKNDKAAFRSSSDAQQAEQLEEGGNKRYFIPDDKVQQPIFGSKKYNPVLQQFECINDAQTSPGQLGSTIVATVSTMETLSEHALAPEILPTAELPGILTPDAAQTDISSTETPTGSSDALRAQHKDTKIWWKTTTNKTPLKSKQQKKGGKKKISRRDDIKTLIQNSSSHNINEIN